MSNEEILAKILEETKKTNVLLQTLVEMMSKTIDLATGNDTFNKDYLDDEVRQGFVAG